MTPDVQTIDRDGAVSTVTDAQPRETHPPRLLCDIYRTRWEIELDNRRDEGADRLDQIRATSVPSVVALVHASILGTVLTNHRFSGRPPASRASPR